MKKKLRYIKSVDLETMYKKSYPDIDKIIWNKPATIVFLKTGEKGICKVQPGDKWNGELGFWVAYAKALQNRNQFFPKGFLCESVIKHMLSPDAAMEILELYGILSDHGIDVTEITRELLKRYRVRVPINKIMRDSVLNLSGLK